MFGSRLMHSTGNVFLSARYRLPVFQLLSASCCRPIIVVTLNKPHAGHCSALVLFSKPLRRMKINLWSSSNDQTSAVSRLHPLQGGIQNGQREQRLPVSVPRFVFFHFRRRPRDRSLPPPSPRSSSSAKLHKTTADPNSRQTSLGLCGLRTRQQTNEHTNGQTVDGIDFLHHDSCHVFSALIVSSLNEVDIRTANQMETNYGSHEKAARAPCVWRVVGNLQKTLMASLQRGALQTDPPSTLGPSLPFTAR